MVFRHMPGRSIGTRLKSLRMHLRDVYLETEKELHKFS